MKRLYSYYILVLLFIIFVFLYNYINKNSSNNFEKYVGISASGTYLFYIPIFVKMWKIFGYTSIIYIISHQKLPNELIYTLTKEKAIYKEIIVPQNYSLEYFSKLCRIFSSLQIKNENSILYISDVDMLPYNNTFFQDYSFINFTIKSFGLNGYVSRRWPMCYFSGTKQMYEDILNTDKLNKENEYELVKMIIDSDYLRYGYCIDEIYMRDKIRKSKFYPNKINFHERSYDNTRFDRGDNNEEWKKNMSANWNEIIDIHLPHLPNDTIHYWVENIVPLIHFLFKTNEYGLNYISVVSKYVNYLF